MSDDKKQIFKNNSMFLYTALIFIAAIFIIVLAFISQMHLESAQPSASPAATLPVQEDLQGIAKSASELSRQNMELLEENRDLNKRLDEAQNVSDSYETLIEAYAYLKSADNDKASSKLSEVDYDSLSQEAKALYDDIKSQIQ